MHMLMQLFFRVSCVMLLCVLVVSCASFPTVNDDPSKNNKVTYNKDIKDCKEDYPEVGSGVHIKQWISCMNMKGWK
jgi:hypothetical protein